MSKTSWILLLLAGLTVFGITRLRLGERDAPENLLRAARDRLAAESLEPDELTHALEELSRALKRARAGSDHELAVEILLERARLFRKRGDHGLALSDCKELLDTDPGHLEALRMASQEALGDGRAEQAAGFVDRLAALAPHSPETWLLVAATREAMGERTLTAVDEILDEHLSDDAALESAEVLRRVAAMSPGAPGREALLDEVCEGLPGESLREAVRVAVRTASEQVAEAFSGHLARLGQRLDGRSIAGAQRILSQAGEFALALELGRFASSLGDVPNETPVLVQNALALERTGREEDVPELVRSETRRLGRRYSPNALSSHDLLDWCGLLHRHELWRELQRAAQTFARRRPGPRALRNPSGAPDYYLGKARLLRGEAEAAQLLLRSVQQRRQSEPANVSFLAAHAAADAARLLDQPAAERHDLKRALRFLPEDLEDPALRRAAADVFERLASIERREGNLNRAEDLATRALSLLPEDRERLEGFWIEVGAEATERRSRVTEVDGEPQLAVPSGPYATWRRAKELLPTSPETAVFLADGLVREYPGHPGGLEVLARAEEALHPRRVAKARLELVERGFAPPATLTALRDLPIEELDGDTLVRWILLDPRGVGPVLFATALAAEGARASDLSLRGASLDGSSFGALAPVIAADGAWLTLVRGLLALPETEAVPAAAGVLAVRGALLPETPRELLEPVVARLAGSADPGLVPAADFLLAAGRPDLVLELLEHPAEVAPEVRLRRSAAAALLDDPDRAAAELERAEPFFDGPDASLGWIALAVERGDPDAVLAAARDLLDDSTWPSERASSPGLVRLRAVVSALSGNVEDGRSALEQWAEEESGRPPVLTRAALYLFDRLASLDLLGSSGEDGDGQSGLDRSVPLERLFWLAAAEVPPWSAWALDRMGAEDPRRSEASWMPFLRARAHESLGDLAGADARLVSSTEGESPNPNAWLWRERIAAECHGPGSAEATAVQAARVDSVGRLSTPEADLVLVRARLDVAQGREQEARERLEEALREDPEDPAILGALLPLLDAAGEGTAKTVRKWLDRSPGAALDQNLPALLGFLDRARTEGGIARWKWIEILERLAELRPRDPAPVLELARATGELERLERFRKETRHRPLEELRRGSTPDWARLLGAKSPERAVDLVREELELRPGSPDLWLSYAEALVGARRYDEAREAFAAIRAVHRSTELMASFLEHAAELDTPPSRVVSVARELARRIPLSPELRFLLAEARLATGEGPPPKSAFAEVREAWEDLDPDSPATAGLSRRLALALFRAGHAAEALQALEREGRRTEHEAAVMQAARTLVERAVRRKR